MPDNIATLCMALQKLRKTNTTDTSFPSRVPTATAPTGVGDDVAQTVSAVFDVGFDANMPNGAIRSEKNLIKIIPFGAGSDTNTFAMRVIGWQLAYKRDVAHNDELEALWIPHTLGEFSCALSTPTGVAGRTCVATDLFCDTITLVSTSGNDDVDISITSPADNTIAHVKIDVAGCQKVEIVFDLTGASSANALVSWY